MAKVGEEKGDGSVCLQLPEQVTLLQRSSSGPFGRCIIKAEPATVPLINVTATPVKVPPGLSAVSMEQARVAICHAFGFEFKSEVDHFRPTYSFSIPEVAWVGLTKEQVRAGQAVQRVLQIGSAIGSHLVSRIYRGQPHPSVDRLPRNADQINSFCGDTTRWGSSSQCSLWRLRSCMRALPGRTSN